MKKLRAWLFRRMFRLALLVSPAKTMDDQVLSVNDEINRNYGFGIIPVDYQFFREQLEDFATSDDVRIDVLAAISYSLVELESALLEKTRAYLANMGHAPAIFKTN